MQKQRIAINGFGRIGRLTLKALSQTPEAEVVAINDPTPAPMLAHLLKYDSAHGVSPDEVTATDSTLNFKGQTIQMLAQRDPATLPWAELQIHTVLEATGLFLDAASASKHLNAGAQQVVLSAPGKSAEIPTVVLGVNDHLFDFSAPIISNASCTTNCLAPMAHVLDQHFGIESGFINTIHAYTADQNLQDGAHKDWRRARAAAQSIIPTTTGAAKTVGRILPHLTGKLDGIATRVPVLDGSLTDFTVLLCQAITSDQINTVMYKAARDGPLKNILAYTEEPLVSVDVVGSPYSCIFDAPLTRTHGRLAKVVGWYDNEMGYAHRTAALILRLRDR